MASDVTDLELRVESLERERYRLVRLLGASTAAAVLSAAALVTSCTVSAHSSDDDEPTVLTVSELIVVDDEGVPRVRVGTDLPDAIIDGRRVPRGGEASGVMLYDETGQERGGYVTMEGNILLTLDARDGQVALFAADAGGGATMRLWREDDAIELRSGPGGARLTAVRDGEVVVQEPSVAVNAEACTAYRNALAERSRAEVASVCRQRFRSEACERCLDREN